MEQKLLELVEESQEHLAANEVRRAHYASLRNIAVDALGVTDIKLASDLNYYRGGWPNADTPPLTETLGKKFASAFKMILLGGDQDVKDAFINEFKKMGIIIARDDVEETGTNAVSDSTLGKIAKRIERFGSHAGVEVALEKAGAVGPDELARHIIKQANELQREICKDADAVKVEKGDLAEAEGIPRAHLVLAAKTKRKLDRIEDTSRRKEVAETIVGQAETKLEIVEEISKQ